MVGGAAGTLGEMVPEDRGGVEAGTVALVGDRVLVLSLGLLPCRPPAASAAWQGAGERDSGLGRVVLGCQPALPHIHLQGPA